MGESVGTKILRNIPIFSALSNNELIKILLAPGNGIERYEKNKTIVREFETGVCMYVILEGELDVFISGGGGIHPTRIAKLRAGDFFGEQALVPWGTGRRNATIKTQQPTKVFRIDKEHVSLCVQNKNVASNTVSKTDSNNLDQMLESDLIKKLLKKMRLFKHLNAKEFANIGHWTDIIEIGIGDFAIKKFQEGKHLYVVFEGSVEIFILGQDDRPLVLAQLTIGQFFGEQALMPEGTGKRNAFVRASSKTRLIKIPKHYFKLVLSRDKPLNTKLRNIHLARQEHVRRLLDTK